MNEYEQAAADYDEAWELYWEALSAVGRGATSENYANLELAKDVLDLASRRLADLTSGPEGQEGAQQAQSGYYVVSKREGLFYGFVTLALAAMLIRAIIWAVLFLLGEFCRAGACL